MKERFLEELRRVLDYSPETGEFRWKVAFANNRIKAGSLAGNVNKSNGRLQVKFQGKNYLSHRLAWLLTYGKWPDEVIDHIDGDPLNNRLANLRDVTSFVNSQNQRKPMSNNKSGYLGVCWDRSNNKFKAQIGLDGKLKQLGYFLTPEEAHDVYLAAKRKFHDGNML